MTPEEIINCESLDDLYMEKVNLTNQIGALHRQISMDYGNVDKSELKADLTTKYAIMKVLDHRLEVLEDIARYTRDEEGRIRYNFMRIARQVLTKETYQKIRDMSNNSLRDMKPMFKEIRKNRVES